MNFKTFLLREGILPAGDFLCGQQMINRLKFLEKIQWENRGQILSRQTHLLGALIRTVYDEVPFYRELMQKQGVGPQDIQSSEDLKRLLVVTKPMIRAAYPAKTVRPTGQKTYESRTSGSTGENFAVMEDAQTAGWYRASFLLALEWSGWSMGEPHLQTGMTLERGWQKSIKDFLLGTAYFSAFDLTDRCLDQMLNAMEKQKINFLWGYPGSLYYLARRAGDLGWNRPLKSAVTWGDTLYPAYRERIEAVFRTRIFDTYGCGEGIQIAAQCEKGVYHLHDLDVIVEFLDDQGTEVPPGAEGNIVVTRLHSGPMPLLRYRIGDRGIKGDDRLCGCGRGFQTMGGVRGRETDNILTPSGNRLIVHFFTGIFEHFSEIDSFQVIQESAEELRVLIKTESADKHSLAAVVKKSLEEKGLSGMKLSMEFVDEIPFKAGKRRFVINKMTPQGIT